MEVNVSRTHQFTGTILVVLMLAASSLFAQKIGYINSQQILAQYQEAKDAQDKLDKINKDWEAEAREMQKQLEDMNDQLESQRLLLSEERQKEKMQEMQALYLKIQQYQNQKWGQNGDFYTEQDKVMKPVFDKVNEAIKIVGEQERFDYIFDTVAGNIVYASPDQKDLTDLVIEQLEKGLENSGRK